MRCVRASDTGLALAVALLTGCAALPQPPVTAPARVGPSTSAPAAPESSPDRSAAPAPDRPFAPAPAASPVSAGATPAAGGAPALLAGLRVQGRGPLTGYDRAAFGQPWADADRNGCDTRNDVLRRALLDGVARPGTDGCVVLRGTLRDPYTGVVVPH